MNENLCLINGVEKVVGWSPLRWNRQSSDLCSSKKPTLSLIIKSCAGRWINVWRLENLAGNIDSLLEICWESARSELIFIAESIGKDADNVSTDDPKNVFDA